MTESASVHANRKDGAHAERCYLVADIIHRNERSVRQSPESGPSKLGLWVGVCTPACPFLLSSWLSGCLFNDDSCCLFNVPSPAAFTRSGFCSFVSDQFSSRGKSKLTMYQIRSRPLMRISSRLLLQENQKKALLRGKNHVVW